MAGATRSFCLGNGGCGLAEISGTGVLDISNAYIHIVGWQGTDKGRGTLHLKSGGTILIAQTSGADGCIKLNTKDRSHFLWDGGTVRLVGEAPNVFFGSRLNVEVLPGGAILDTGDFSGTISRNLIGDENDGGFTKKGSGILYLTGSNAVSSVTVEAGTLVAYSPDALPGYDEFGKITVKAGARLLPIKEGQGGGKWTDEQIEILRTNATVEEGGAIVLDLKVFDIQEDTVDSTQYFANEALKLGPGMLTLTAKNSFGGRFTVSNGVLNADFGQGVGARDYVRLFGGLFSSPSGRITANFGTSAGCIALVSDSEGGFTARDKDLTVDIGGKGADKTLGDWGAGPKVMILNDAQATAKVTIANHISYVYIDPVFSVGANEAVLAKGIGKTGQSRTLTKRGPGTLTIRSTDTNYVHTLHVCEGRLACEGGTTLLTGGRDAWAYVGSDSADAPAEYMLNGGEIIAGCDRFLAGNTGNGTSYSHGRLIIRNGTVKMTKADAAFAAGNGGDGYVEVGGGTNAVVDCSLAYAVILPNWDGYPSDGVTHGELRILTNGTVISKYGMYSKTKTKKYATFIMDGGTFRASQGCTDTSLSYDGVGFLRNITNVWMGTNGGTIDTQTYTLYAAQPIEAWTNQDAVAYAPAQFNDMPALTKKGRGLLRLTGANTYLCATAVDEGRLLLNSGATIPQTPLRLGAAGTFDLGKTSQTVTHFLGSGVVSNGTLTVTGDIYPGGVGTVGTLTVGDGCTFAKPVGKLVIDGDATGCDKLVVSGALDVSGLDLVINCENLGRDLNACVFLEATGGIAGQFKSVTYVGRRRWVPGISGNTAKLYKNGLVLLVR